jgi:hypothetical protein
MLDTVKNGKNAKNGKMQQLQDGFAWACSWSHL